MPRLFALLMFLLPVFATPSASAQTYPVYGGLYVNDLADIINEDDETTLRAQLKTLFKDHGVEATVLTIDSRHTYGDSPSIERFATGLFNTWGIGNAKRNDGILILIARNDREMRIELGRGYSAAYDAVAGDVIDQHFLPSFKYDKYSKGIRIGTTEIIRRIALPMTEGKEPPARSANPDKNSERIILFGFFTMLFGMLLLGFRRIIGDVFTRFRNCPKCGRKGLRRLRKIMQSASYSAGGNGIMTTSCNHCDYRREQNYSIPRRTKSRSSSGGSFGGGSSSGGGASGRW